MNRRFSGGLSIRGVYTLAKAMDDGDSLNATAASNAVALLSNPYNPMADWGPATYDVRHAGSINVIYALPVGQRTAVLERLQRRGQHARQRLDAELDRPHAVGISVHAAARLQPVEQRRFAQSRPAVPQPGVHGTGGDGNPNQWFNPNAFIAPPSNSGFYGDLTRNAYSGPGLATWDFSAFKDTRIGERPRCSSGSKIFNLLNRANFNTPNLIVAALQAPPNATLPEVSPTAGQITSTSTTSRQVQLGIKLLW